LRGCHSDGHLVREFQIAILAVGSRSGQLAAEPIPSAVLRQWGRSVCSEGSGGEYYSSDARPASPARFDRSARLRGKPFAGQPIG
jgi:hypothetical protein